MNKIPPKIFIYGFVITVGCALAPFFLFIWDWYDKFDDAPPVNMIWHQLALCGGGGAILYWRKYKAQLELPPDWSAAWSLAQEVKTTKDAEGNVTKTVEKTTMTVSPVSQAAETPPLPEQTK